MLITSLKHACSLHNTSMVVHCLTLVHCMLRLNSPFFPFLVDSHAELRMADDPYVAPFPLFDPDLGPFLATTFVLTHEYMLVQVGELYTV